MAVIKILNIVFASNPYLVLGVKKKKSCKMFYQDTVFGWGTELAPQATKNSENKLVHLFRSTTMLSFFCPNINFLEEVGG